MQFIYETERFDIVIPEGQDTLEYNFTKLYLKAPRVVIEEIGKNIDSITVTSSKCILVMKDTAGYNGLAIVTYEDNNVVNNDFSGQIVKDNQDPPHYWKLTIDVDGVLDTVDLGTEIPDA